MRIGEANGVCNDVADAGTGGIGIRGIGSNGIGGVRTKKVHIRRIGLVEMIGRSEPSTVVAATAGFSCTGPAHMEVPSLAIGADIPYRKSTVGRLAMTGDAGTRIVPYGSDAVAIEAADTDAAI